MLVKMVINQDSKSYFYAGARSIIADNRHFYAGAEENNIVAHGDKTVLNDRTTVYTAPSDSSAVYYDYARCIAIADELDAIVHCSLHTCPECGEYVCGYAENENGSYTCADGHATTWEPEPVSMSSYLVDVLNVEYRVNADHDYKSIKIMTACGGPNIYIDTETKKVSLYWGNDYAEASISSAAADEIDNLFLEMWEAGRC